MPEIKQPPTCKRTDCQNPVKWKSSLGKWGTFCSNDCYRRTQRENVLTPAQRKAKVQVSHGEAPECAAEGCHNPVKWRCGCWNTFCSQICNRTNLPSISMGKRREPARIAWAEDDEPEVIPKSWLSPLD